ncbi:MAG: PilW family protein, partial [Rhodanobacter sp.]
MARKLAAPQRGVTLIELMVAMVLGLVVAGGIITVFSSTSDSNKAQTQLARLQEEGRFAITRLSDDLRMANGLYCSNTGGSAKPGASGTLLDQLRSPTVYANDLVGALGDVTTVWGTGAYPAKPTSAYSMPSFLYMRGYDCTLTGCAPVDPSVVGIPAMGTTEGSRVMGADVVTVRYVNSSSGWSIGEIGGSSVATSSSAGDIASVQIVPLSGEPAVSNFSGGDLAMLADCSNAQIFAVGSAAGGTLTVAGGANMAGSTPVTPLPETAPRLFDVNRDFQTVTYYLQVVSVNNDAQAPFTGALRRRVNGGIVARGGSDEELVRGVERLDFRYGVQDATGNTTFLSANDVDASTNCPPQEFKAVTNVGCLWRAVKSIEVSILMNGQAPLYTLAGGDTLYAYSADA